MFSKKVFLVGLIALLGLAGPAWAGMTIVANENVADSYLSKSNLQEIFLGKRVKWSDNTRIHFVLSGNTAIHQTFLKSYVGRSVSQFHMHWRNMVFTGQGRTPKSLSSDQAVLDFVANTRGAVGYINGSAGSADVKTVTIN